MTSGNFFKPFQILRNVPEQLVVFSDGAVFGYCYDD
jgi:hypothetical protein